MLSTKSKIRMMSVMTMLAMLLSFANVSHALAAPPTTEVTVVVDFTYTDSTLCGFPIVYTENGTFEVKTYYDGAGNPIKLILTNMSRYTETATANGKTLTTNWPAAVYYSLENNTAAVVGLRAGYHVPGAGVVLLETGRVVFDLATGDVLFTAGEHQLVDSSAPAFCNYFEP
jgi:hypothetical protein